MGFHQSSVRAGRYIRQPAGYQAFIPAHLPPNPGLSFDESFLDLLSTANHAVGRLDGCTETLPNPDLFVFMYIRKEAVLSSQIEGTQASLMDVLAYEAAVRESVASDVGDVFNYVSAMDHGLKRLKTLPLSLRLIKEIHGKLLSGLRGSWDAGEFRNSQNWIGPARCLLKDALFVPPPPHEMNIALGNLENFVHEKSPMPYLLRVGIAHAQFETIHPFVDGNGRLGRLLITFMLCEHRMLRRPLLYLSYFFKKNRTEYYDRLQAVRDGGHWEEWLAFFLKGVAIVAEEATLTARKIVNLRERHRRLVAERAGRSASRALQLLENLYRRPIISVSQISQMYSITFQGANDIVKLFGDMGILKETTGHKRHRVFAYMPYLSLLGESASKSRKTLPSKAHPRITMAKVADFYSINEASKPASSRVYHNNDACPPGRDIPTNERRPGTGGYRLCADCERLNKR